MHSVGGYTDLSNSTDTY